MLTPIVSSSTGVPSPSKRLRYSPTNSNNGSSSDGVEEEDDDTEQERKKPFRRQAPPTITPMQVITTTQSPNPQDEFDHFGAMVAASLRRVATEQGHMNALRIQRRLYDAMFAD